MSGTESRQNILERLALLGVLGRVVRLSPPVRYGMAVAAVGIAALVQAAIQPVWAGRYPFILFFPAIMVSAWQGGLWPGILASLLSALAVEYLWLNPGHLAVRDPGVLIALVVFVVIGILISALNEAWRRGTVRIARLNEAELAAEERFHLAVEAAPTAMIMVDRHGTIVFANALTETLLGYGRRELIGLPIDNLVPDRFRSQHADYRHMFATDARQRPMGAGRDLFALRKDGTEVPVEIGLSPFQTGDGLFVLAAVTDITERRQFEEARERLLLREQTARAETERASGLKDEFLAVLSHELRTPLNAILGYAHLLNARTLSAERTQHALDAIQRNAHAQARLVESLLDLSRVIAGKLELDLRTLDLSALVHAAIDVVSPDADAKGIRLNVATMPMTVVGDAGRLQQVFWNLLSNAVKFTPRGGEVRVRLEQTDSQVRIQVTDTGQGIRRDFLPFVFDRFKQGEGDMQRRSAGLGLGLALVSEIVQAHGGTVDADSPGEGRGSTFTVVLPVRAAPTTPATTKPSTRAATAELLTNIRVLIVDDEADVRELLSLILESRGAQVRAAPSAAEAFDAIGNFKPDVLLADLRMPEEDGYSLIHKVRARERERRGEHLPAIAVTAYASPSDRARALDAGYDGHLAKPVVPDEVVRVVADVAAAVAGRQEPM